VTFVPGFELGVRPRTWYRLHVGTTEVGVRVVTPKTGSGDATVGARLVLDAPVPLRADDRFVIRTSAPLNTIAGGVITDPYASKRARPWDPGLSAAERLTRLENESGSQGLDVRSLPVRLGLTPAACERLVAEQPELGVVGNVVVTKALLAELTTRLVAAVEVYQATASLEAGMPVQAGRSALVASDEIVDAVLVAALSDGQIVSVGGLLAKRDWQPTPSGGQVPLLQTLVSILGASGAEPPTTEELGVALGCDPLPLLRFLERRGEVVQVEQNRYYDASQLTLLLDRVRLAFGAGGELGPGEVRDALGLSRKYVIPMLEYCDRRGYTERGAKGRVWREA